MELPKYTHENQQERIGVHYVGLILAKLGLIFRETANTDVYSVNAGSSSNLVML